jgi:cyanophycinase-like exopeptidase
MVLCAAIYVQEQWADALGLVGDSVALPHFERRDRDASERARRAVSQRGLLGLGIDESTALVWSSADGWQVAGRGRVQVLASSGVTAHASGEAVAGLAAPA